MTDGERAVSRVTIDVTVAHDGAPEALAGHLSVEVEALVERWGSVLMDSSWRVAVVHAGDDLARELPVIHLAPSEDDVDRWL